jgi:hypothetical protein
MPVIQIDGVSDVIIRGFRIEGSSEGAIAVLGQCGGVVIDEVECIMPEAEGGETLRPAVAVRALRPPGRSGPVVLRNSRIETPALGRCVQVVGSSPAAPDVRLEGNLFGGQGVLVLIGAKPGNWLGDVVVEGNLFVGGPRGEWTGSGDWYTVNGLNLNLESLSPDQNIVVNNNTFVNVRTWLGLVFSLTDVPAVTVANNLILRSEGVRATPERLRAAALNWRFEGNCWEPAPHAEEPLDWQTDFAQIRQSIEVLHRDDPDHPDFARPPPNSCLFDSGWDEEGLPTHVGAKGPQLKSRL